MVHQAQQAHGVSSVPEELYNLTQLADVTLAAGKLCTIDTPRRCTPEVPYQSDFSQPPKDLNYCHTPPHLKCERCPPTLCSSFRNKSKESVKNSHEFTTSPLRLSCSISDEDFSDATFSAKNYVHKIFDKRKVRKLSYQSDDSAEFEAQRLGRFLETQTASANQGDNFQPLNDGYTMSGDDVIEDGVEFGEVLSGADGDDGDVHNCPECGKKYSTSSNLARHRQTHRSLMDKKARRCPHCDKVYVSMPAFSMHVRTHNQGCECPHCGKRFSRPWLLQGHIRTHTGEKPFQCSICAKAFADKSNLRAHIQTHSNTKPHSCTRCGKSFALKSYLYKHEESSCIRSLGAKSGEKETKPLKSLRSDSSYSSCSSNSSQTSSHRGSKKQRGKSTNTELQKRFKEKLRDKLRAAKESTNEPYMNMTQFDTHKMDRSEDQFRFHNQDIVMDSGSQKSYIQLMNPIGGVPSAMEPSGDYREKMHYSRCSVIRTVPSIEHSTQECPMEDYSGDGMLFYGQQETPVDFSPKTKFTQSTGNSSGFEMVRRSYMMVA